MSKWAPKSRYRSCYVGGVVKLWSFHHFHSFLVDQLPPVTVGCHLCEWSFPKLCSSRPNLQLMPNCCPLTLGSWNPKLTMGNDRIDGPSWASIIFSAKQRSPWVLKGLRNEDQHKAWPRFVVGLDSYQPNSFRVQGAGFWPRVQMGRSCSKQK